MLAHVIRDRNGTEHDVEIARAFGAQCPLYSVGHHARARFCSLGAPVVDDLRDVVRSLAGERRQRTGATSHVSEKPAGATPSPRMRRAQALT